MATYTATTANGNPIIVNTNTGVILNAHVSATGRRTVKLYYNHSAHTHNFAHAWVCLALGMNLATSKTMHVHHIDHNRCNDIISNWMPCCNRVHVLIHKLARA